MTKDILTLAGRYHAALNNFDFAAIEKMFAEDAEYHSTGIGAGVGGLYGRSAIMEAMKAYFTEFSDQVSADDSIEAIEPQCRARPLAAPRHNKIIRQKSASPGQSRRSISIPRA